MHGNNAVERLYEDAASVVEALRERGELSLEVIAADNLRKALLLAAASYFEHCICRCVLEFVREQTGGSIRVESFVQNKAISRQYHTWFKWDERNANYFFSLFGSEFKDRMNANVRGCDRLRESIQAFMELGNDRNRLVHQDYATFHLEKTLEEIYKLYEKASRFVEGLPAALRECDCVDGTERS